MLLRVLIDTSVMRAGLVSATGASRALLLAALDGEFIPLATTALLLEYEDVLLRPDTLAPSGLTASEVRAVLDEFCLHCRAVAVEFRWRPQSTDAGDDLIIDAAVNGMADGIATFNVRDLRAPAARFGIAAETPADVLRRLP